LNGKTLSAAHRARFLRAVNRVLEQRKSDAVTADALFDPPAPKAQPDADASDE